MRQLSKNVKVFGNGYFNFYLVGNKEAILIECGTRAAAQIFSHQWNQLHNKPHVKYILVLHSHFDHVCGLPVLKKMFPDAKVVASTAAQKLLSREKIVKEHFRNDVLVSERYLEEGFISETPAMDIMTEIDIDITVGEGDSIEIEPGLKLNIIDAPGHSPCSIAAYLENDQIMFVSDAVGFISSSGEITPIFFQDYSLYVDTINKLLSFPTKIVAGAHGSIATGEEACQLYQKSLASAKLVSKLINNELNSGVEENTLTNKLYERYINDGLIYYPKEIMMGSMNLLIKRAISSNNHKNTGQC
jgi:glyoxylase-like metal-dependent hydrolase (beta-lactamase superfamily II)